jgi:hypothetical protein
MDPIAILSLASNLIQVITFTKEIISNSCELYRSADGLLVRYEELKSITHSLNSLVCGLEEIEESEDFVCISRPERHLRELGKNCKGVVEELLAATRNLRVEGKNKKWSSIRQALNSVWNESKIDKLEKRVDAYRSQIETALLFSLR